MKPLSITTSGQYDASYAVSSQIYDGVDFSRYCYIFQGQGGVTPKMCSDLYYQYESIQKKFLEAEELLQEHGLGKISWYITNPEKLPQDKLHIYGNISLYVIEVAMFDILLSLGMEPKVLTAHSFGEYAMLTAGGVIPFETMLEIVCTRELLSEKPHVLGYLVAIKESVASIESLFIDSSIPYYFSNINSHHQTVVAVTPEDLLALEDFLKKKEIAYVVLHHVPQPYHSPLMEVTRKKFYDYVCSLNLEILPPSIDFISSVTWNLITKETCTKERILYIFENQLLLPVQFIEQIYLAYQTRNYHFIEIGVKNIYSNLMRDIIEDKEYKTAFAGSLLKEYTPKKKSDKKHTKRIVDMVNTIIGKVTGYAIADIHIEQRFQEDVGVDSIKKANIVFQVLHEMDITPEQGFATSDILTVEDIVTYVEEYDYAKQGIEKKNEIFSFERKELTLVEKKSDYLEKGSKAIRNNLLYLEIEAVISGTFLQEFERSADLQGIVFVITRALSYEEYVLFFGYGKKIVEAIKQMKSKNIVILSREYDIGMVLSSFFKSLKREIPGSYSKHISLDTKDFISEKDIHDIIMLEMSNDVNVDVIYNGGVRFVPTMSSVNTVEKNKLVLDKESVIVALGGVGGVTYSLLQKISAEYRCTIHLLGRREYGEVEVKVKALEKENPGNIMYHQVDVTDEIALGVVFANIHKQAKKIDYCIHGAGILSLNFIHDKNEESIRYEFAIKVKVAETLLFLAKKYSIKKVILFSSILSYYGSAGQSIYAAANAKLTTLVNTSNSCTVINWPAWDSVGMTEDIGVLKKLQEYGVPLIDEGQAYTLFKEELVVTQSSSVYYLTKHDDASMSFMLSNYSTYEYILGKPKDSFNLSFQNLVFEKEFNIADSIFLFDHKIQGVVVLPGAYSVVAMMALSYLYYKKIKVLHDISFTNMVTVDPSTKVKFSGRLEEEVLVLGGSTTVPTSNSFVFFDDMKDVLFTKEYVESFFKQELSAQTKEFSLVSTSIYKDYFDTQDMLSFGESFRSVHEVSRHTSGFLKAGIFIPTCVRVSSPHDMSSLLVLIDSCFQVLSIEAFLVGKKVLPKSISQLVYFEQEIIPQNAHSIIKNIQIDEEGISADIALYTHESKIMCALFGVTLAYID